MVAVHRINDDGADHDRFSTLLCRSAANDPTFIQGHVKRFDDFLSVVGR